MTDLCVCDCACILESGHRDISVESQPHSEVTEEPKDDETAEMLPVETSTAGHLALDTALEPSSMENVAETSSWTTSTTRGLQDLMQFPIQCTSGSEDQCAYLPSHGAADSSASGAEDANPSTSATAAIADQPKISERSFVVHCSDFKTEDTNEDHLTLAEYKERVSEQIRKDKEAIKSYFTILTANRLRKMGIAEDTCNMVADLVMEGEKLESCADDDHQFSSEDIYEFYRYWKDVESYQVLVILAERDQDELTKFGDMMDIFCIQAFPEEHFSADRLRDTITWAPVYNCQDVENYIKDFFRRRDGIRAKTALHTVIVFFGHGSPDGFNAGNQRMPLNNIIELVRKEWKEALPEPPPELPVKVEIIFTQCWGHEYSQDVQSNCFRVTSFSTVDSPLTNRMRDVIYTGRYFHVQATPYAANVLRPQVLQMEEWRRPHVDLAAAKKNGRSLTLSTPTD